MGQKSTGAGCLALFALPFAAVGVFAGYLVLKQVAGFVEARGWVATPATILEAELRTHDSSDSTTYSVHATYLYEFEGRTYTGTRVGLSDSTDNIGDYHEETYALVRRHRDSGEPLTAWVDPGEPAEAVLFRQLRGGLILFEATFFLLFGGVGFGLLGAIPYAKRRVAEDNRFKDLYPTEPWRWREEWRGRTIRASSRAAVVVPMIFAVFWNLLSWPLFILGGRKILAPDNPASFLALLFPLIGIFLAIWAARAVIRWRRFGDSELELSTRPVPVGGRLEGRVLCGAHLPPGTAPRLRLTCYERRRSGKNSERRVLWQDETAVEPSRVAWNGARTDFPIAVALPDEGEESEEHRIQWQLEVSAEIPGVDYSASFEIPVFGQALPGRESPADEPEAEADRFNPPTAIPAESLGKGIEISPDPSGGTRYVFGRARQKGAALMLTAFAIVWTGIVYLIWKKEAPLFFLIAFGLAEVLILLGLLDMWLTRRVVVAGQRGLTFRTGFLALGRQRTVRPQAIESLHPERGMQSGNKLYYRVMLKSRGNKNKQTIAGKLDNIGVARHLVALMKRDLGIDR